MPVACVIVVVLWWFPRPAHPVPEVEHHPLNCGSVFPCPPEIRRRVDFWIKVFRSWRTDQVIFHDARHPERVYSVITTKETCSRKRAGRTVERERKRIRKRLQQVAAKLAGGRTNWNRQQKELLELFPTRKPKEIRSASKRIRCQQGNRDRFIEAFKRYGTYRDYVTQVLRENRLSEDIQYLPFVESAYNPRAYSRVGAAGMWQIMPRTARNLGLQLNATIDERFDPEAATWGAARYLLNATRNLTEAAQKKVGGPVSAAQINPFVITSYNYGVSGMRRAIRQFGPDYVTVLRKYKSHTFRNAVRNFYASFLAARYVARNAKRYFGDIAGNGALRYSQLHLKRPTSVKRIETVFNIPAKRLKQMNPALTRYVWRGWRLIPEGYVLRLPYRRHGWARKIAKLERLPAEQPQLSGRKYVVRRGDTACAIADAFDVRCRDLIQLNGLGRRALIRVGQKLDIPGKPRRRTKTAAAQVEGVKVAGKAAGRPAGGSRKAQRPESSPAPIGTPTLAKATTPVPESPAIRKSAAAGVADLLSPLTRPLDLRVNVKQVNGNRFYSIRVHPEETLGHYADWLGIGYTRKLRRLNGLSSRSRLRIGQRVRLPIKSAAALQEFEDDRAEYHRTLVDEFREHYEVIGLEPYIVKKGDSLWQVARVFELPYWVLTRYNPQQRSPDVGERILVPTVEAKKPQKEPPRH